VPDQEAVVSYYLSGTALAPVIYVEGPDWWRSYRPGRILINEGSGPIPYGFKGALQPMEALEAEELLDSRPQLPAPRVPAPELRGLGGWLVLVLIELVLTFVVAVAGIIGVLPVYSLAVQVVYLVASAALLTLAFLKKHVFARAMIGYIAFGFLVYLARTIRKMVIDPSGVVGASGLDPHWMRIGADIFGIILGGAISGLWVGYFLKSKRMKNTFTRPLKPFWPR
jgi:hypothetical protein